MLTTGYSRHRNRIPPHLPARKGRLLQKHRSLSHSVLHDLATVTGRDADGQDGYVRSWLVIVLMPALQQAALPASLVSSASFG